jgi:PAS domain S-box-containing protein
MAGVLIVDDEPVVRETLVEFLAEEGYQIATAGDVHDALAQIALHEFDVVVADILLPGASGLDLLERARESAPGVKVVLITGQPSYATAAAALRLGAFDYLAKPVNQSAIRRSVASALRLKKVEDENRFYRERLELLVEERTRQLEGFGARLRDVAEHMKGLLRCHDLDQLAPQALALFADNMAVEGGSFYLLRDGALVLLASLDPDHSAGSIPLPLAEGSVLGRVVAERQGVVICDIAADGELRPSGWSGYRDGSLLALPCLDADGEVVGVVTLHNKKAPPFGAHDMEIGRIIAGHCVEAIRAVELNRRLRDSERRYRALIERSTDAVALMDRRGRTLYASSAAERLLGHRPQQLLGRLGLRLIHPEDRRRAVAELRRLAEIPEGVTSFELRVRHRDGSYRWLEVVLSNLLAEPAVAAIVVNFRDIGERKRSEREKAELTEQVQQSQKMEALGRLAGGVAHDFNNLLTTILGYAELIGDGLGPEHALAQDARELQMAGERATALTRQLLTFSRRQIIQPHLVDLNLLLRRLQNMLTRLLGEDVALSLNLAADLWQTEVDPTQLDQILMNLVANARAAMPRGGRLVLETANVVHEREWRDADADVRAGEFVMLSAADTGCGMDHETALRVFEPFFTTKQEGTGLGLATVYGIVKQHRGGISFSSELGVGTTFRLYFPRAQATTAKAPELPAREALPRGTETVLLVEDEASVRSLVRTMLEMLDYKVLTATQGEDAVELADAHAGVIHLLVTDVVMPGINGRELSESLRATRPEMKCLFVSGYTRDVIAQRGILEQGIHLLAKPFSIAELAASIRSVLDERSA